MTIEMIRIEPIRDSLGNVTNWIFGFKGVENGKTAYIDGLKAPSSLKPLEFYSKFDIDVLATEFKIENDIEATLLNVINSNIGDSNFNYTNLE